MSKKTPGNPINVPQPEQDYRGGRQSTRSFIPQGLQVGRNSIDRQTSSSSLRRKGSNSNGGASLALNGNRMGEKRESNQPTSSSYSQYSLSTFSAGAPSQISPSSKPARMLQMRRDSESSRSVTRSSALTHQAQYRNASTSNGKVISSSVPAYPPVNSMATRSSAKAKKAEVHIVLDDSDDDDKHINEQSSSSQSPQHRSPVLNGSGKGKEQEKQSSRSPAESHTATSDTELENEGLMMRKKENIESNGKVHSPLNSRPQNDGRSNSIEEQNMSPKHNDPVSPENHTTLTSKSFNIAKPFDKEKSNIARISQRMKGRDGQRNSSQTKSLINSRSTPVKKAYDDSMYNSGLNSWSKSPAKPEKPLVVKLRMVAFVQDGSVESIAEPFVEWKMSGESIEIGWEEDGKGLKRKNILIKFVDCESFRASKDSSSMLHKPHRYLEIKLIDGSDSAGNVYNVLENVKGFGSVHGSNLIVLDAINNDAKEEHNWVNLRKRFSKLRNRTLLDLENDEAEEIQARIEKMRPLSSRNTSTSPIRNIKQTPIPRPKPRPSVPNASNQIASTSTHHQQRTSDVRGVKRDEEKEYPQIGRETAKRTMSRSLPSKSPSPKKILDPNKKLLTYPFQNSSSGYVTILQSDLDRLEPHEFLNDTMIDFGLKYLLEQIGLRDPDLHKEIFIFSSFFYNRLKEKKTDRIGGYELVKKWTRKAEIFKKKYIVVPINENLHWYLALIINPLFAIPEEIRNGEAKDKDAQAGSEYNSAISSPKSGAEPIVDDENKTSRDTDLFLGEIGAQHQHASSVDEDGDTRMFPVVDKRTRDGDVQTADDSDAISNDGGGSIEGGGDKRKQGISFAPGESFLKDENEQARSRRKISSQGEKASTSNEIPASSFYGQGEMEKSPDYLSYSPVRRRSGRLSGNISPTTSVELNHSRRSSFPQSQEQLETWRKQLNEEATICIFDSLQQKHPPVRTAMKHYLANEYADKHNLDNAIDTKNVQLNLIDVTMPRQPNWADCGLYLLHAFERFFSDPKLFKDEVIPSKNERHPEWESEQAKTLREFWKQTIERLTIEYQAEKERREKEKQRNVAKKKEEGENELTTREDDLKEEELEEADEVEIGGVDSVEEVPQKLVTSTDASDYVPSSP